MPPTTADVTSALAPDEPDYRSIAAQLGADAAPVLLELAGGDDAELASKAVSLAPYLPLGVAAPIVVSAAGHAQTAVRVAAAAMVGSLGPAASEPASRLLTDADVSVRSWTLRSLEANPIAELRAQLASLAVSDPSPQIRDHAARLMSSAPPV
jgi:hypothetical protein